jgi:hypothetical protein
MVSLATLWPAADVRGGTYYLAPSGDDVLGDGSRQRPWRTVRHAARRVPDDGSTIVLLDGLYVGSELIDRRFSQPCTVRAEHPYQATLRSPADSNRVFTCYAGRNVILEGLELVGSGATQDAYLVHVSSRKTDHVTFADCIIHDSYNNDLVKVNAHAHHIAFRGCIFFNQNDHEGDEHLDINTVTEVRVEGSIFFNDFPGSGRELENRAHSFVVIKNSGNTPNVTQRVTFRRNIFLNWQGKVDQCYVLLGEDGKPFYEAQNVLIENNLFLHHSPVRFWGTLLLKGGLNEIAFRSNTIIGHPHVKWSGAFAAVCQRIGNNPPMGNLVFCNNIWCDTSGEMPRFSMSRAEVFARGNEPVLRNNLYFNGGKPIPSATQDLLAPGRDAKGRVADPKLGNPNEGVTLPRWDAARGRFLSGEKTIREEFVRLVRQYAALGEGSAAIDAADTPTAPRDDILGNRRGARPDIGCFEKNPETP